MKILCVDNDPANLETVVEFLQKRFGCQVIGATSSDEAILHLMQNKDIHLVMSELKLVEGSGEKIWNHLRRNNSDVPFVWMTYPESKKNKVVGHSLVESSINQFLSKPVNEIGIISVVETQLRQREKKKEVKIILDQDERDQFDHKVEDETSAEWSLKVKSGEAKDVDADWVIGKIKMNEENLDDRDLTKKSKDYGESLDDRDLRKAPKGEQDADWSLGGEEQAETEGLDDRNLKDPGSAEDLNYREEEIAKARQLRIDQTHKLDESYLDDDLNYPQEDETLSYKDEEILKKQGKIDELDAKRKAVEKFNREQAKIEAQIPEWEAEELRDLEDSTIDEELRMAAGSDVQTGSQKLAPQQPKPQAKKKGPPPIKRHPDWNIPVADFNAPENKVVLDWDDEASIAVDGYDPNNAKLPGKRSVKVSEEKGSRSSDSIGYDPLEWNESMLEGEIFDSDGYVNEPIGKFLNYNTMVCDLYIRLSGRKILKIVNKGDLYEKGLLEKYIEKGVQRLYLHEDDHSDFQIRHGNFFRGRFLTKNYNHNKRILNRSLNSFTYDQLHRLGVSKSTINVGQKTINESLELVRSDPKILKPFSEYVKGNNDIVNHSILLSYICMHICIENGWDSEVTLQELCLASLFHDIFQEEKKLAIVGSLDDEKAQKVTLNEEETKLFYQHPERAAAFVVSGEDLYPNVTTIIRQHHETPEGTGFPQKLNSTEIIPLACIFIIAEDFVHRIYKLPAVKIHMGHIQEEMRRRYHHNGNFHKIYEGFERAFPLVKK